LPRTPPGWNLLKSLGLNSFLLISVTARASPMARSAVVLVVGASPSGHASLFILTSITISLCCASVEAVLPVNAIILHPIF